MSEEPNPYCERLGIAVPSLAAARSRPDANTYALLIVALLQRGRPMTLADVALDFEAAGIVDHADDALFSLSRCRPARAPVYRDGDLYSLDPHDAELDLWVFRLGSDRREWRGPCRRLRRRDHCRASRSASRSSSSPGAATSI